jgi:hypothetical protein
MKLNGTGKRQMYGSLLLGLCAAGFTGSAQAQTPDTTTVFDAARKAELEAEAAIRKHAEFKPGPPYNGQECDEHIGKWCVYYEPAGQQPPKEPGKVGKARAEAIVALTRAFELAPGRTATVLPLVRLLVKDGRPDEAVQVAQAYARANDSVDGHMVSGYALHYARRTEEALEEFGKWIAGLPPAQRHRIEDIDWLVSPGMVEKYRMSAPKLWRYADALYMTPGNETLADHFARHAYTHMMAVRPVASNRESWAEDEEQLIIRFGPDVVVTRSFVAGPSNVAQSFLGHWDNTEHTYFPPDFERVVAMRAPVDTLWPTDTLVGRSGHAPPVIRFMRTLQHQAAVFPGLNTLIVAGGTKTDKASAGKPLTAALFLLDANLHVIARGDAVVKNFGDSLVFVGQMPVADDARFFSAEVYDPETRFAARARYRLEPPAAAERLTLSGIMLTKPFAAGALPTGRSDSSAAPLSRPVVAPGQTVGVYSEVTVTGEQPVSVNVELEVRSIDKPSTVTRLAGWVGSRLGFAGNSSTPGRLGWTLDLQPHQNNVIALTIDPGKLNAGRYLITLKVTDPAGGGVVLAEREFLTR